MFIYYGSLFIELPYHKELVRLAAIPLREIVDLKELRKLVDVMVVISHFFKLLRFFNFVLSLHLDCHL